MKEDHEQKGIINVHRNVEEMQMAFEQKDIKEEFE